MTEILRIKRDSCLRTLTLPSGDAGGRVTGSPEKGTKLSHTSFTLPLDSSSSQCGTVPHYFRKYIDLGCVLMVTIALLRLCSNPFLSFSSSFFLALFFPSLSGYLLVIIFSYCYSSSSYILSRILLSFISFSSHLVMNLWFPPLVSVVPCPPTLLHCRNYPWFGSGFSFIATRFYRKEGNSLPIIICHYFTILTWLIVDWYSVMFVWSTKLQVG